MGGEVSGHCDERFSPVHEALQRSLEEGRDAGASIAVTVRGEMVVDIWGGVADEASGRPWERDTIVNVYSTTKTMTNLCALVLADRGELDLHGRVVRYWPEFAQRGKEAIEVRHLLSHSSGLSGWDEPMTAEDLYDWEQATSLLAGQAPWWEPGTASGYHSVTQGYLVGELIRRVTGQSPGTFFRRELAEPLGADFHIGLPEEHDARVATLIPPPPLEAQVSGPESIAWRTFTNPLIEVALSETAAWRRAEIPAANGHGNARAVARVHTVLANGGEAWGHRLLSAAGCERALEEQTSGIDLVLGMPIRFGMGFGLPSELVPVVPRTRSCFWGGWGGSLVVIDMEARVVWAYMMNRMGSGLVGDDRGLRIARAVQQSLAAAGA